MSWIGRVEAVLAADRKASGRPERPLQRLQWYAYVGRPIIHGEAVSGYLKSLAQRHGADLDARTAPGLTYATGALNGFPAGIPPLPKNASNPFIRPLRDALPAAVPRGAPSSIPMKLTGIIDAESRSLLCATSLGPHLPTIQAEYSRTAEIVGDRADKNCEVVMLGRLTIAKHQKPPEGFKADAQSAFPMEAHLGELSLVYFQILA